jgi:ribosomal protein S18 acetylase RimI-like enzyme
MDVDASRADATTLNAALTEALPGRAVSVRAERPCAVDLDFSAALYESTRDAELAVVDWSSEQRKAFCRQQFEAQHAHYRAHYPLARFLLIEADGMPIGRVYFEHTASELRLMEITIAAAHRNQGVGSAISSALLHQARRAGVPMGLHVESFNRAKLLYERQGFRDVETRGIYVFMRCE